MSSDRYDVVSELCSMSAQYYVQHSHSIVWESLIARSTLIYLSLSADISVVRDTVNVVC